MNKVVIIGCGNVGITYAYALINTKMNIDKIVLIDKNKEKLYGNYLDLCHALYTSENNIIIKMGDYSDIEDAKIICITAGPHQGKNKTRLDDINDAKNIFIDITNNIKKYKFNGIFLIASNPNDVMCYAIHKYLNYDTNKIIGSGVILDTSRLIDIINKETNYQYNNIKGYVLGEHGDSSFVVWDDTYLDNNKSIEIFDNETINRISQNIKIINKKIVKAKSATYYGVSTCLCKITKCILNSIEEILPLSCYDKEYDVFIGNIAKFNENGIEEIIKLNLNKNNKEKYINSVNIIKEYNNKL